MFFIDISWICSKTLIARCGLINRDNLLIFKFLKEMIKKTRMLADF